VRIIIGNVDLKQRKLESTRFCGKMSDTEIGVEVVDRERVIRPLVWSYGR
jgi:hypothetical protein